MEFFLRSALLTLVFTFTLGFIAGLAMSFAHVKSDSINVWLQLVGLFMGCGISIVVFRDILGKRYKGYRITVVYIEPEQDQPAIAVSDDNAQTSVEA